MLRIAEELNRKKMSTEIEAPSINRRKFVTSLGLLGTAAGLSPLSALAEVQNVAIADGVMKCKPYLQAAHTKGITVRWITNTPCYSWVEYGESADKLNLKARQIEDGMVQVENTLHAIPLTNLKPSTIYFYRAVSEKPKSLERRAIAFESPVSTPVYSFTTPATTATDVNFLVFNDIHDRPESFPVLMKYQGDGKKDFVLLNGDMFNTQTDENQIVQNLLNPLSDLFSTGTPFIFARGNHETHGKFARSVGNYFDGQENKYYYSFSYGPMYAIVLDSGDTKSDQEPVNGGIVDFDAYREKQAVWLAQEVKKPAFINSKFKVVFIHIPPFYIDEDAHASNQYGKIWLPILNASKIDLMLCGHTHKYGIHPAVAGKHNFPIVIGGGPKDGRRTIIQVKANQQALNLKMTDDTGKVVGTLKV
jgi:predicted MPP superfamily phosphohydrolase